MSETKQKTAAIKPSKRAFDQKKKKKGDNGEPTKDEYAVAKFVRFKCPTKKTTFGHHGGEEVTYFVASKAVDILLESKWCSTSKKASKKKDQHLFSDRQTCVDFMQQLLMKGLFFRAKKLVPKVKEKTDSADAKKDNKSQGKKGADAKDDQPKSPKAGKEAEGKRKKKEKGEKDEESKEQGDKEKQKEKDDGDNGNDKGKEKSSKVRKFRLDWHNEQLFIDGPSIYVWKYDPTPLKTWLLGLGIVLGAIALCLFPLWPAQIRIGIYYLSCSALVFFGAFFGFIILRTILFGIIWAVTLGRHHLWLFPNLTEDCGVLDSFKPVYSYKYVPPGSKATDDKEKKKKSKKSDSEDEGEGEGGADDEDVRESKDDQGEDRGSESGSGSDNENDARHDKEDESATGSQDDADDYDDRSSNADSNDQSARTSADEEPRASTEKTVKKRRARRDDRQESNNGDFEFVENPNDE